MTVWSAITGFLARVPAGMWAALLVVNIVLTILTLGMARRRIRAAGRRAAHPDRVAERGRRRNAALTVASLVPAALFWGMVLAGSFHGLVAFGRNTLGWNDGTQYLVPGTLDGVSVTFAFLAFRAIHKHHNPGRSRKVVWAASLSSATVNFAYEYGHTGHNLIAGAYLAVLSVFGMVIFHEFLAQFEEGTEYIRHGKRPAWGLRWVTSPCSTFRAAVAWENYPPADGTPATVRCGLENLERVRALRQGAIEQRILERHARKVAAVRRAAHLAAARANPNQAPGDEGTPTEQVPAPVVVTTPPAPAARQPAVVKAPRARAMALASARGKTTPSDPRVVPTTAATVREWAEIWVAMCADGDLIQGPLNDDEYARATFRVTGRQLRNIRTAVVSGALTRRAAELGVELPAEFTTAVRHQVNDHRLDQVAA